MNEPRGHYAKQNKIENCKYYIVSFIFGILKKYNTYIGSSSTKNSHVYMEHNLG